MRFHLVGLVHLPTAERYVSCAFTQKNVKLCKMLLSLGHEVYLYGAEGSDAPCTELVVTHSLHDIQKTWGDGTEHELGYDWRGGMFRHDFNTAPCPLRLRFNETVIREINHRKRDDDFLLLPMGSYQRPIADGVKLWMTCEPGIGYRGSYARFRAFESSYIQNFTYGSEHPRQSINGHYYDRVIPNYWDDKDFTFRGQPEDYYLFVGRMIVRKGVWTAVKATQAIGARLVLAGQADSEVDHTKLPQHCTFVGHVDAKERDKLMGGAIASFVPTTYLEPFGGVSIEANLTGTPVLTTNFGVFPETIHNGVNGYRCDTLDDFAWAAQEAPKLNRRIVRKTGERYLMDSVRWDFQKWFDDIYALYESAAKPGTPGWHRIRDTQPEWREKVIHTPS